MDTSKVEEAADFIRSEGVFFLAHLMRRLSDEIVQGCEQWYPAVGLKVAPRTASTLHLLRRHGPRSVTEIATAIRQSHPLVIGWIKQLEQQRMVKTRSDPDDRRRTVVSLTRAGEREADRMIELHDVFDAAYKKLAKDADADVLAALWRMEGALRSAPFVERLASAQSAE
ncbi:MarR family winged helix-turn-helix transcriptional regulator [Montanilutibacter psychrotolerans]|uniref:MarR family transcriptional regulator n=1 Tax=Montanilutibacter psychrotolerans TaxID=1327343 RepID=A0A3M8SUR8_9GAMM|nr:MarR family transcriptional regulator [Lysobacter psychrotolerans]RNF84445.1 MarR family transcriptional regulator [Lysobacter psychrotolerans]